jgi:hypothetical protein
MFKRVKLVGEPIFKNPLPVSYPDLGNMLILLVKEEFAVA